MRRIIYTPSAGKQLLGLPQKAREQIATKIVRYAETGAGDVKALVGQRGLRLRVGDYRVVFVETRAEIVVYAVGNRRDAYR
jgi:mRNA interferase RelE/StbE